MENTLFESFCRTNNLTAFLSILSSSSSFSEDPYLLFQQSFVEDPRNPVPTLADLGPAADDSVVPGIEPLFPLPLTVYRALLHRLAVDPTLAQSVVYRSFDSPTDISTPILNPTGQILRAVTHRGRRYTDVDHHRGDSQVSFVRGHPGATDVPVHGLIQSIFLHRRYSPRTGEYRSQVFVAVKAYRILHAHDASADCYRLHRGLGARLVYVELDAAVEVLPMQDIISHFVACPYEPHGGQTSPVSPTLVVVDLDEASAHTDVYVCSPSTDTAILRNRDRAYE